jgi:hypothetical protein
MDRKRFELFMLDKTEDIANAFEGYSKFEVEIVRGNLWLLKPQLQNEEAVKLEEGQTYDLDGFVKIRDMSSGKSKATLSGYLY